MNTNTKTVLKVPNVHDIADIFEIYALGLDVHPNKENHLHGYERDGGFVVSESILEDEEDLCGYESDDGFVVSDEIDTL